MSLSLTAALAAATLAAQPQPISEPGVGLGVDTSFPLTVGGTLHLEVPGRVFLRTGVGWMPRSYLDILNDILVGLDTYDENTAELIADTLESALLWRTHLGWRPFAGSGFTLSGGYALMALGGRTTAATAISTATGISLPEGGPLDFEVDTDAMVHQASVELGWQWRLTHAFSLEALVGGFYTFDASNQLEPQVGDVPATLLTPFIDAGERYLDDTMESRLHGGYVTLRGVFWLL